MASIDWNAILPEIIKILPNCFWIMFIGLILILFRSRLDDLFKRITRLNAGGIEFEFDEVKEQLELAIKSYASPGDLYISDDKLKSILIRAKRLGDLLRGARILWVDDTPLANANIHRFLNELGIVIDNTTETEQALKAIEWASSAYEVVISDMQRRENGRAGIDLIEGIRGLGKAKAVILFMARNPEGPKPEGAWIMTNRVDVLVNAIFDIIEDHHQKKELNSGKKR